MITLSSDFGTPYPAAMKGVVVSRSDARLVDVAHDFPRQDVRTTAFWLREVLPWFPPAVHLVVVDPGVGTDRDALVIRAGEHALVGPDNGVLVPAVRRLAAENGIEAFVVGADHEAFPEVGGAGETFDGRDVFAPAAAAVHETGVEGVNGLEWLSETEGYETVDVPDPEVGDREAIGDVLAIDGFGNAITNVPGSVLEGRFGEEVAVNGTGVAAVRSYARVDAGERLVTVGSHGKVELAVNGGRGDDAFGVGIGSDVWLSY